AGGAAGVGDPVGARGQDRAVVDDDGEGGPDLVGLLEDPGGAEPDAVLSGVEQLVVCVPQVDAHGVPGLVAVAARPPQLGVRGRQARYELVGSGVDLDDVDSTS